MTLFAPDLYRSFALGFAGTTLALGMTLFDDLAPLTPQFVPEAQAAPKPAPVTDEIAISEEFLISNIHEEKRP
jgi:hypothetical protein